MTHPNETPEPLAQEQAGEMAIRDLCVGRVEWHCSTDDGAYCMSFDRDNSRDPEREAAEWLERHQRDYPHRFMAYKVRRVVVQSQLQEEALALLSRLSDATAALQAKDAEIAGLKADAERTARNRDMWKGQCERQAEQLTETRAALVALHAVASVEEDKDYAAVTNAAAVIAVLAPHPNWPFPTESAKKVQERNDQRYRWMRRAGNVKALEIVQQHCLDRMDAAIDAEMGGAHG